MPAVTLIPLNATDHTELLQAVYTAAPAYWSLYQKSGAPTRQAAHDLAEAANTPGRTIMGMLVAADSTAPAQESASAPEAETTAQPMEMVGMLDMRQHYPGRTTATIGMIIVAENHQRQGIATGALALLEAFITRNAGMHKLRVAVEQFNPGALHFFQSMGFRITGEAARTVVNATHVRLLYMEKALQGDA